MTTDDSRPTTRHGALITILFLTGALLGAAGGPALADPLPLGCLPHPAIRITEDHGPGGYTWTDPVGGQAAYRPGSGVIGGSGTAADPYLIEGWCITPLLGDPATAGIHISDTTAHARIVSVVYASPGVAGGGVLLEGAKNVAIEDSTFSLGSFGVRLTAGASQNTVAGNELDRNLVGVHLDATAENLVSGNVMRDMVDVGVLLESSSGNTVEHNIVDSPGSQTLRLLASTANTVAHNDLNGGDGVLLEASHDNVLEGNTVTGTAGDGVRMYDGTGNRFVGNVVDGTGGKGIHLDRGSDNEVGHNQIHNVSGEVVVVQDSPGAKVYRNTLQGSWSPDAVQIGGSSNTTFEGNEISSEQIGINIWDSSGSLLHGNNVTLTEVTIADGIMVHGPGGVTISANNVTGYTRGIYLFTGAENVLKGNHLLDNSIGLDVYWSIENQVHGNVIEGSEAYGIRLWQFAKQNDVTHNTVTENLGDGIYEDGWSQDNRYTDNNVTHNGGDGLALYSGRAEHNLVAWNGRDGISGGWSATANEIHNNTRHGVRAIALGSDNNLADNGGSGLHLTPTFGARGSDDNWWGHPTGPSGGLTDVCFGGVADGEGQAITSEGAATCFNPYRTARNPDAGPRL